ncbi:MAG TPA: AAC(3)-I family aminoglycoside N-acetyltransferase [Sphingorhabdus sp.]|jgi:aminoglycoside 3-N-acetyltransferase I|nr:AAC(3)-I family aminoglycoside N-acetyltransferase [Sphingorhabdus sp.]
MRIVRLSANDLKLARGLNALFAEAFEEPEHYAASPPDDGYLLGQLTKPHIIALAALEDDQVVAALVAYELPKLEQARSEIYIYDLAVAQAHRRKGIASALIAETRSIASRTGAWVVYVQADYGDEPAIALYTKLGHREDVMHFDIAVAGGNEP